ncbi:hypothetical protein HY640_01885 [Candidatus Woesearchaeota archaeon]|nr:hypothetical protein [Candidatus Woesearchaeota archaeon]
MADFDLGYFYYMHDKIEEAKELEASGSNMMSLGMLLILASLSLAYIFSSVGLLVFSFFGIALFIMGVRRHSRMLRLAVDTKRGSAKTLVVSHQPLRPAHILRSPSIIRESLSRPFSEEISLHVSEKQRISRVVRDNSGADINTVYRLYRQDRGVYEPEHFVKALHSLKKHGLVEVRKI